MLSARDKGVQNILFVCGVWVDHMVSTLLNAQPPIPLRQFVHIR